MLLLNTPHIMSVNGKHFAPIKCTHGTLLCHPLIADWLCCLLCVVLLLSSHSFSNMVLSTHHKGIDRDKESNQTVIIIVWDSLTLQTSSSWVLTSIHLYSVLPSTKSNSRYRSARRAAFICCTRPFWLWINGPLVLAAAALATPLLTPTVKCVPLFVGIMELLIPIDVGNCCTGYCWYVGICWCGRIMCDVCCCCGIVCCNGNGRWINCDACVWFCWFTWCSNAFVRAATRSFIELPLVASKMRWWRHFFCWWFCGCSADGATDSPCWPWFELIWRISPDDTSSSGLSVAVVTATTAAFVAVVVFDARELSIVITSFVRVVVFRRFFLLYSNADISLR